MPRPRPTDQEGNPLPFQDFDHYGRLEHLVPNADCDTRAGKITVWRDSRPQPSYDEMDAVSDADADLALLEDSQTIIDNADDIVKAILEVSPGLKVQVLQHLQGKRGK